MSESPTLVSDEDIVSRYPAPIAGAWHRVISTREPLDIHKHLIKVYEATLTYLVVGLASQYRQADVRDPQVDEALRNLDGRISVGHWTGMLRELTRFYSSQNLTFFAELPGYYLNTKLGPQMSRCCDFLASIGISLSNPKKVSYLFEALTAYRNEVVHRDPDEREMVKVLRSALQELLSGLHFITNYRLVLVDDAPRVVKVEQVRVFRHTLTRLMGKDPLPLPDNYDLPEPLEGEQVYLTKGEDLASVLNLHPLIIARGAPAQVYVPNSYQGKKPVYFCYQIGRSLPLPPDEDELKLFVESLTAANQDEPVSSEVKDAKTNDGVSKESGAEEQTEQHPGEPLVEQQADKLVVTEAEWDGEHTLTSRAAAYRERGTNAHAERKYEQAVSEYSHAIELVPNDAVAYNGRGLAWRGLESFDQAIADFSRAIELNPDYPDAYYNRARVYAALGRKKASRLDLEKASELGSDEAARMLSS
ncbi:MAG: hypothetical protein DLM69_06405 [Candidatus Chloroheliales bacterium]|nr:MAG: hypothetical protein DLM69_06405 [Chloroflexota bacterium]